MAEVLAARQFLKKTALVLAYSLFIAFGTAAMLTAQDRPLDERGQRMVVIMALGGLTGSLVTLLFQRWLALRGKAWRFVLTFMLVALATLAAQGMLTGVQFYEASFISHEPFSTLNGWLQLVFTSINGFAYFYVFGLGRFWAVVVAAAVLFAFGFLTLRFDTDTTEPSSRRRM